MLTGTKPPGPASKTGATPLGKSGGQTVAKSSNTTTSGKSSAQGKERSSSSGSGKSSQGKSGASKSAGSSSQSKSDRRSPVRSPKPTQSKDDEEEAKVSESSAPKVPPLKIVIPGGACGSGARIEQEGEGSGQRGSGKGRNSASTLPYVIPCTSTDAGNSSDSSDANSDDRRPLGESKSFGQRVLRSHRITDDRDKDAGPSGQSSHIYQPQPSTVSVIIANNIIRTSIQKIFGFGIQKNNVLYLVLIIAQ